MTELSSRKDTVTISDKKNRKNILFITYNFPPKLGGIEQVVQRTWTSLSTKSNIYTLAQFADDFADETPGVVRPTKKGLLRYFSFLYREGRRLISRQPVDIVVSMSALTALPAMHLAKWAGAKSVVIIYGLDTIYLSWLYQAMYRYSMPKIDRVISISHATRDEAVARGVSVKNTTLVHPGCNSQIFLTAEDDSLLRNRWGLENAKVILIAGRLVKRKGVDRFIRECLPLIVEKAPDVKLLLAGGNPRGALAHTQDMELEVDKAIRETGLEENVILTGRLSQEEMVKAFYFSDVVVLPVVDVPGDMEGFGIVLIEAGATGKPAVASNSGGIPDAIQDGVTGTLVPPDDYQAMATAVLDFLLDPVKARKFGEAGKNRVIQDFDWQICAEKYANAIIETP